MDFMFGMCHPDNNLDLVKEAGVNWIRYDIKFPFKKDTKEFTENFIQVEAKINTFIEKGFKVFGITPFPGFDTSYKQGSIEYYKYFEEVCEFLGKYFEGRIEYWQVCNEINIPPFRQGLSLEQAIEFVKYGARGLRKGCKELKIGINPAGFSSITEDIFNKTYNDGEDLFDYAGIDGYPGSWEEGGPETWIGWVDKIYEVTKKPIIVAEFGYSSYGEVLTDEEKSNEEAQTVIKELLRKRKMSYEDMNMPEEYHAAAEVIMAQHYYKKWGYVWNGEHSPKVQAEYLEKTYNIFKNNPNVIGAFWFCWKDTSHCFWCGQEGCPCEIAWGLVDIDGKLKDAYYKYQDILK